MVPHQETIFTIMVTRHKEKLKSGLPDDHAGGFLRGKQVRVLVLEPWSGMRHEGPLPHTPRLTQGPLLHPASHLTEVKLTFCTRPITEKKLVLGMKNPDVL